MNRVLKVLLPTFAVAAIFVMAQPVLADMVLDPTVIGYSSQYSGRDAAYTTDGVVLVTGGAALVETGDAVPTAWPLTHNARWWLTNTTPTGSITYQMPTYQGATNYDLSGIFVWNYNEAGWEGRSAKDVSISVEDSKGQWTPVTLSGGTSGNNVLDQSDLTNPGPFGDGTSVGQLYSLTTLTGGSLTDVAVVKIDINSNWGGYNYVGLTQVRFVGSATPAPEPGALVLLGTALVSLLCYAWRKRK